MKTTEVITQNGPIHVPSVEVEGCPGLAVTSCVFGLFEVTHIKSGQRIIGGYERAVNAMCTMIEIYLGMKESGIDPTLGMEELQQAMIKSEVKCKILGNMTVMEHVNILNPIMVGYSGEFPWEGDEDSPFTRLDELKAMLLEQ
ncbi:hypothetical protein ACNPDE_002095 [Vibrio fluvialis]